MREFHRIMCATDFSEPSDKAFEYARTLALRFGAEITLLHVVEPIALAASARAGAETAATAVSVEEIRLSMHDTAEDQLRSLATRYHSPELKLETRVVEGKAGEAIVAQADADDVDLIVIATHGHSGWHRFLFGSVTEKVIRSAHRPVLTISPDKSARE
jgi:nucleotide-binding universal stress UspA family protein